MHFIRLRMTFTKRMIFIPSHLLFSFLIIIILSSPSHLLLEVQIVQRWVCACITTTPLMTSKNMMF